jgi:hypothetical protein
MRAALLIACLVLVSLARAPKNSLAEYKDGETDKLLVNAE